MTRPTQTSRERDDLLWFQARCPELADYALEMGEANVAPDGRFGDVSVEHTEFHRGRLPNGGSPRVGWERAWWRVVHEAEQAFGTVSDVPLVVQPYFKEGPIPADAVPRVAMEIAALVGHRYKDASPAVTITEEELCASCRKYVHWIAVYSDAQHRVWCVQQGGALGEHEGVAERIQAKTCGLNDYRERFRECWLLIVAPGFLRGEPPGRYAFVSSLAGFESLIARDWHYDFDRVYVADRATGRLALLPRER